MISIERFNQIKTWDELVLFCINTDCPVGNENMDEVIPRGHHKFLDVHSNAFERYFCKTFTRCGLTNFQNRASMLFLPEAYNCKYVIVDDSGCMAPASTSDFTIIKTEIFEWALLHCWNKEVA